VGACERGLSEGRGDSAGPGEPRDTDPELRTHQQLLEPLPDTGKARASPACAAEEPERAVDVGGAEGQVQRPEEREPGQTCLVLFTRHTEACRGPGWHEKQ
jgi:hypothetical protein